MMSAVCFCSRKVFVLLIFLCACVFVAGNVQAEEVSPEEAKRRAALEHYKEKLRKQNEGTVKPVSTNTPEPKEPPKVI